LKAARRPARLFFVMLKARCSVALAPGLLVKGPPAPYFWGCGISETGFETT
jgi:hypothetical protein